MTDIYFRNNINPVGKIAEKTVCKSVTWHCILSAELTKNALFQTVFFGDFARWEVGRLRYFMPDICIHIITVTVFYSILNYFTCAECD